MASAYGKRSGHGQGSCLGHALGHPPSTQIACWTTIKTITIQNQWLLSAKPNVNQYYHKGMTFSSQRLINMIKGPQKNWLRVVSSQSICSNHQRTSTLCWLWGIPVNVANFLVVLIYVYYRAQNRPKLNRNGIQIVHLKNLNIKSCWGLASFTTFLSWVI